MYLAPHDTPRLWQRWAMVGRDGFDDEQQQVVLTLYGGAWLGGLVVGSLCVGLVAGVQGKAKLL